MTMLANLFMLFCVLGILLAVVGFVVVFFRKNKQLSPSTQPKVSILRPLKGLDEHLEDNIASLADGIRYSNYEVLLGVESLDEPAAPIALAAERKWPGICRCVVMDSRIGLNPKVNQLHAMYQQAQGDIIVVSDSNVQVEENYLEEIAAFLENPQVGIVTNPIIGWKSKTLGSRLESLHLGSGVGAGMISAQAVTKISIVIGKSMALRRDVLDSLGGFYAFKDYLAEDFVMGRTIEKEAKLKVKIAFTPIKNVTVKRSIGDFYNRFLRWGVLQRTCIGIPTYLLQGLLNPTFWALWLLVVDPSVMSLIFSVSVILLKSLIDTLQTKFLGCDISWLTTLVCNPLKDVVIGASWVYGGFSNTVMWRGNKLRVDRNNRLLPSTDPTSSTTVLVDKKAS